MKILIVTPYFHPSIGGAQKYVLDVARGLKNDCSHEIIIVTSGKKGGEIVKNKFEGMTVYRLPYRFKVSNTPVNPKWGRQIREIIKAERPAIINAHAPVPFMADVAVRVAGKIPVVFTYHSGSMKKNKFLSDIVINYYEAFILLRSFKKSREVVTYYLPFTKSKVADSRKINFIPPSTDTNLFKKEVKTRNKESDILFVGRIEKSSSWKGIGTLLRATAEAAKKKPSINLTLVGSGDAVKDFKKQSLELGIQNNVHFAGDLHGANLVKAYNSTKALVLPSETESESFGIVLIEAMACGIPVIGSNVGGIPEVIEDGKNGILVPPKDPKALSNAILQLIDDKEFAMKLGECGLQTVAEKFSMQRLVKKTNGLLLKTIGPVVVHVTPTYPPKLGGMEKVVQNLARTQSNTGLNVSVITSNQGTKKNSNKTPDTFPTKQLRSFEVMHTPILPMLFMKLLRLNRHTLIHLHVAQPYTPEMVWLASKIKKFHYLVHFHLDVAPSGSAGFLLKVYKPLLLKRVLKAAQYVVVFTNEQKLNVHRMYDVELSKIVIIPNGVSDKFYYNKLRLLHKKPKLLFVGRLTAQKNLSQLLLALDGISSHFETSIVGDGEQETTLKNLAKKLKLKNLTFHGRADDHRLIDFYKEADIFVLPSEREGMPLVLLEAMAMALPVVATDVTGNRDVIKTNENGLLVPVGEVEVFRSALVKIKSDKKMYQAMSQTSRKLATRYSWEKVVKNFRILYGDIAQ